MKKFDYICIGAGLTTAVLARKIAEEFNKKVVIIEKRDHIAGNIYDKYDDNGISVHMYGPHIFHTNNKDVWDYLSRFTEWNVYFHEVLAHINGKNTPIPFNFNTMKDLFPDYLTSTLEKKLIEKYDFGKKVPILDLKNSNDPDLKFIADFVYDNVFLNYTLKQWGMSPEEIDPNVTSRVPVNISSDNRYFSDKYQGHPKDGYTKMIDNMINHENITLMLKTDMKDLLKINYDKKEVIFNNEKFEGKVIFTGMIDEFFNYKFGELPYRSLKFDFLHEKDYDYIQEKASINYPNNYDFTRITEFKHLTKQKIKGTTFIKEYPQKYEKGINDPYYPVFTEANQKAYEQYKALSKEYKNIIFAGRLAEYKYYDMDDACENALNIFKKL